ncbi:MAG: DUF1670 domain-containing protein [Anaerolineae bacterium]
MANSTQFQRLTDKSTLHAIQSELQQGYSLSPVEALVLARRLQDFIDQFSGEARSYGQIAYQAIAVDEPPGKPLVQCQKVSVHLTLFAEADLRVWAQSGSEALRRLRVHRLVHEALLQGGALSQEDLACLLGLSLRSVKRIFAYYREQDLRLPSRGEIRDIGPGVSHKIPIIRKYVQDLSFSRISQALGNHGIDSMTRYLRHFALVMILHDRGLSRGQMQSVIGLSENLIAQYQALYAELNTPEHARPLERLKRSVLQVDPLPVPETPLALPAGAKKGVL